MSFDPMGIGGYFEEPRPDPFAEAERQAEKIRAIKEAAWEEGKQAYIVYATGARNKIPYPTNPYKKTKD